MAFPSNCGILAAVPTPTRAPLRGTSSGSRWLGPSGRAWWAHTGEGWAHAPEGPQGRLAREPTLGRAWGTTKSPHAATAFWLCVMQGLLRLVSNRP